MTDWPQARPAPVDGRTEQVLCTDPREQEGQCQRARYIQSFWCHSQFLFLPPSLSWSQGNLGLPLPLHFFLLLPGSDISGVICSSTFRIFPEVHIANCSFLLSCSYWLYLIWYTRACPSIRAAPHLFKLCANNTSICLLITTYTAFLHFCYQRFPVSSQTQ